MRCLSPLSRCGWAFGFTLTPILPQMLSPDLGKLAKILTDASVQTMPLRFDWGGRTFQTGTHVHVIHIWGVWAPSQVVDGHIASHSHRYHHRCFPRFVRVGWNPIWCKCAYHATMLWLRLKNLSNCISCPCHTFMRCLSTFSGCGWAYGFTFTPLPPQMLPQIWESWLKSYLMQVCKPCHNALIEAVEPFKLLSCPCHIYMRCLSTFSGCGWAYGFTFTSLPPQLLPQICESWLKSYLMQMCKPCHYALMSMAYIYEVFEDFLWLWMCIWLHIPIVTTTDTSPDLGKLPEILPDASVQTMPLGFDWGCRIFQTAFYVNGIPIWGVWAHLLDVDRHMASHSLHHHHRCFPRFGKLAEILPDASVQTMSLCFDVHGIHLLGVWVPSKFVDVHMASHSHCYHHRHFPRFGKVAWNPTWCKCANHATTLWLRL